MWQRAASVLSCCLNVYGGRCRSFIRAWMSVKGCLHRPQLERFASFCVGCMSIALQGGILDSVISSGHLTKQQLAEDLATSMLPEKDQCCSNGLGRQSVQKHCTLPRDWASCRPRSRTVKATKSLTILKSAPFPHWRSLEACTALLENKAEVDAQTDTGRS